MKYYIGIDLGGTNVRTLLVDENDSHTVKSKMRLKEKMDLTMFVQKLSDKLKV